MKVWALCGSDWVKASSMAAGVKPCETPPTTAESIEWDSISGDLMYFNLHGFLGQPNWFGQKDGSVGPTAVTPEGIRSRRWDGVVVFAEVCYGAGSEIAQAFLQQGARAFIGSTGTAYGRIKPTILNGEADRLMYWFRNAYSIHREPARALVIAKTILRILSYPLSFQDLATLNDFVCLKGTHDERTIN